MPERRKRRKSSRNVELSSLFTFRLTVTGIGGSWSRNPEQSSLLDSSHVSVSQKGWDREAQNSESLLESPRVFASQKCQQSQGSGGSWSRSPEQSSLLDSSHVSVSQKGWDREAQNSESLLESPRVFASQKCQQSQGSGGSWSRSPEQSSLLDSPLERGKQRGERRKER